MVPAIRPVKMVPMRLSCRNGWPGSSRPIACISAVANSTTADVFASGEGSTTSEGTAIGDVWVYEWESTGAPTVYPLTAGERVEIYCTVTGETVRNLDTGIESDLWNRVDGGYVPDVMIDTGTTEPTMPPC